MSLSSTTGTIIKISHPGGYFPGTKDRIVHLIGGYDSLIKCMEELLNINEYVIYFQLFRYMVILYSQLLICQYLRVPLVVLLERRGV